eukprot:1227969-Amphidinium_carterae.1
MEELPMLLSRTEHQHGVAIVRYTLLSLASDKNTSFVEAIIEAITRRSPFHVIRIVTDINDLEMTAAQIDAMLLKKQQEELVLEAAPLAPSEKVQPTPHDG